MVGALLSTLSAPASPAVRAGVDYVFLDRHARRDWVVQRGNDADWAQFRVALEHGHDVVLARRGDEVVGWAWMGYERVHLAPLGHQIRLPDGAAYLYDVYVRPAERGRGIGAGLVSARCARADWRGIERLLSHVLVGNEPSLRALQANRFEIVGRAVFVRALLLRTWIGRPLPGPRPR
jgi:ribosomal protein S18 acetylase RimI-like enzyme